MKPRSILLAIGFILGLFASSVHAQSSQFTHVVQPGETLLWIALHYDVDLQELAALNDIANSHVIYARQELAIPGASRQIIHIVQRGEILGEIAKQYGVDLQELKSLNDLRTSLIHPGQELTIPGASPPAAASQNNASAQPSTATSLITHIVQPGEVLSIIANQYGITLADLMRINGIINPHRIALGQELRIWTPDSVAAANSSAPDTAAPSESRQQYTVQRGETLSQIGYKLGIIWIAIAELNGISNPHTVYPGTVLVIPNSSDLAAYGDGSLDYHNFDTNHPGARVGKGRELVVVLDTQMAYAYEDGALKRRARVSTGLPDTPTVQGDFAIKRKYRSTTMSGPDYHLENVEWVMYFYAGYGFHGTWWHNNFGQPMSHGCVNMTNADAKWFYDFASIGTPVHVRA